MISNAGKLDLEKQMAKALVGKGNALDTLDRKLEATNAYDEVIKRFGSNDQIDLRDLVSEALLRKGNSLADINKYQEAIDTYNELVNRFGNTSEPTLLRRVAMALFNKGAILGKLNRREEALKAFQNLVDSFKNIEEAFPQFITGLLNIGGTLIVLQRYNEAVKVCNDVIRICEDYKEYTLNTILADALVNKSAALLAMNQNENTIEVCNSILRKFGNSPYQKSVARALVIKGNALVKLDKYAAALDAYNDALQHLREEQDYEVKIIIATAMANKGYVLSELNRSEESLDVYNIIVEKFANESDYVLRKQVASALNGIGFYMLRMAKQQWLNGDEKMAKQELGKARDKINKSLEYASQEPIMLGNLGYIEFLLGNESGSREILTQAIRLGGEQIRQAELKDADIFSLPQDKAFRELVMTI